MVRSPGMLRERRLKKKLKTFRDCSAPTPSHFSSFTKPITPVYRKKKVTYSSPTTISFGTQQLYERCSCLLNVRRVTPPMKYIGKKMHITASRERIIHKTSWHSEHGYFSRTYSPTLASHRKPLNLGTLVLLVFSYETSQQTCKIQSPMVHNHCACIYCTTGVEGSLLLTSSIFVVELSTSSYTWGINGHHIHNM